MRVEKLFNFLVEDYKLTYKHHVFENCYNLGYTVYTHSFFNRSGCFTIYSLPQRGELDFYYAKEFSEKREELCEKLLDICSIEKEIWDKHTKFGFIKNPFFWRNEEKVLTVLAEVLKAHINKHSEFFGILLK